MKLGNKIVLTQAPIAAALVLSTIILMTSSHTIEHKLVASMITFILGSLISWGLTRRLLTPLHDLKDLIKRIGSTDDETQMHLKGRDEVAELAYEFNLMTLRLKQYHQSSFGQLMDKNLLLQTVFDSFPDPIFVLGPNGKTLSFNHAALEMFGTVGALENPLLNAPLPLQQRIIEITKQVLASRRVYHSTHMNQSMIIDQNNRKIFLLPWATPIYKKGAEIIAVSLILQNVSQSPLSQVKDHEILATLVHEFKPPLMAVHMAIHACLEEITGPLTQAQKDVLSNAREACQTLQQMTNEFLDIYRLEDISRHYNFRPVALADLIKSSLMPLHQLAQQKGMLITLDISPLIDEVRADPQYLESVFVNVINNAIRFGDHASKITIKVREEEDNIMCEIHNEGSHIAKKHQKHIFEKYYSPEQKEGKGVGLGLYIAHEIIISHGGQMGVKSSKVAGTTFWFVIPIYKNDQKNESK
jgi:NtrC-family two-component system sensor histidine kinase KinB